MKNLILVTLVLSLSPGMMAQESLTSREANAKKAVDSARELADTVERIEHARWERKLRERQELEWKRQDEEYRTRTTSKKSELTHSSQDVYAKLSKLPTPKIRLEAESGDVAAQWALGARYYYGKGVPVDLTLSYKWLNIAASSGDEVARDDLGKVALEMTQEQIAEAQKMCREWKPKGVSGSDQKILFAHDWLLNTGYDQFSLSFEKSGNVKVVGKGGALEWTWAVASDRFLILDHGDGDSAFFDFGDLSDLKVQGRTRKKGQEWILRPAAQKDGESRESRRH